MSKGRRLAAIAIVVLTIAILFSGPVIATLNIGQGMTFTSSGGFALETGSSVSSNGIAFPDANTVRLRPLEVSSSGSTTTVVDQIDGAYTKVDSVEGSTSDVIVEDINANYRANLSDDYTSFDIRRQSPHLAMDDSIVDFRYNSQASPDIQIYQVAADVGMCAVDSSTMNNLDCSISNSSGYITFTGLASGTHEVYLQQSNAPTFNNPKPTGFVSNRNSVSFSVGVNDQDFPDDTVTVEFFKEQSSSMGTDTVSSQGTATATGSLIPASSYWYVEGTDSSGITARTSNIPVRTPGVFEIRNASDNSLITASVSATFTAPNGAETGFSTSSGEIDANGLRDVEYDVSLSAAGYQDASYVVNDIARNGTFAMSPSSDPSQQSNITFILDDQTGNFPAANSTFIIERQVGGTWQPIHTETWGADQTVALDLTAGVTYRLRVRNDDGDVRIAQKYTVPQDDETVTLTLTGTGGVETPEGKLPYTFSAKMVNGGDAVQARYSDLNNSTTGMTIVIHKYDNSSPQGEIFRETFTGPHGNLTVTESLTQYQKNWTIQVDFRGQRNGREVNATRIVNEQQRPVDLEFSDEILAILVAILLVIIAAMFVGRAPEAGIIVSLAAGGLWVMQLVPDAVSIFLIVTALFTSVIFYAIRGAR